MYALFEIAIATAALATPAGFTLLQNLYRDLAGVIDPQQAPLIAGAARAVLAFVLLLIPTALMGTTLPLAVRAVPALIFEMLVDWY